MKHQILKATMVVLSIICLNQSLQAQQDRILLTSRVTLQNMGGAVRLHLGGNGHLENILTVSSQSVNLTFTSLYEEKYQFKGSKSFHWFAGVGLHAGRNRVAVDFQKPDPTGVQLVPRSPQAIMENRYYAGAVGIAGIEYKLKGTPIVIGIDCKPYVNFFNEDSKILDAGIRLGCAF